METAVASSREQGSSLLKIVIALFLALLVTTSALLFLQIGQGALAREPEVVDVNANIRSALARLSADLTSPVATNVENFQIQYMQGLESRFLDAPSAFPSAFNPATWLTAVRFTIAGAGADESPLRRSLSTTVSLRNQLGQASMTPTETVAVGWN